MVAISNSLSEDGFLLREGVFSKQTVKHLINAIESLTDSIKENNKKKQDKEIDLNIIGGLNDEENI